VVSQTACFTVDIQWYLLSEWTCRSACNTDLFTYHKQCSDWTPVSFWWQQIRKHDEFQGLSMH
jgi:hypothetical protein